MQGDTIERRRPVRAARRMTRKGTRLAASSGAVLTTLVSARSALAQGVQNGAANGAGQGSTPGGSAFPLPFDLGGTDPVTAIAIGAGAIAVSAVAWALRISASSRHASVTWSDKLAQMEAALEKSTSVLSAHPGLVLVWEDDYDAVAKGWGAPRILGGPATLASLMSLASVNGAADGKPEDDGAEDDGADIAAAPDTTATPPSPARHMTPADRLLDGLGGLPLEEDGALGETVQLSEKIKALRAHGVAFSGAVYTRDGRAIEVDGRVAGDQVALWLTDPAARLAEDDGIMGRVRQKAADLHGALSQLERAPIPAWRRDADLQLVWVNAAYVAAVEASSPIEVLRRQIELDSSAKRIAEKAAEDRRVSEARIAVNISGARRAFRIVETPMHGAGDAGSCGFAIDVTELEKSRTDLTRHLDANRRTLDEIPAPVAIFDAAQSLTYYNTAFQTLWGVEEAELAARPSIPSSALAK